MCIQLNALPIYLITFVPPEYYRDAIIVSVLDCVTSVFAGLVIFSIIGYMAEVLEQDIEDVATEGNYFIL